MSETSPQALIIGAGPVGLFAVFELGLQGISAAVVDVLDRPGGQCAELYPEKPIYDIPAWPTITGQELTDRLLEQIAPFSPSFHFCESVTSVTKRPEGGFHVTTDHGTEFTPQLVIIAAGGGLFSPKKPPIQGLEAYEGKSVFYAIRDRAALKGKHVVIAGGGDSALDWSLLLHEDVASLTLVHRRDKFRAAPHSVNQMQALVDAGKVNLVIGQMLELQGADGQLQSVTAKEKSGDVKTLTCDVLLPFFGLTMTAGPVAEFGLEMENGLVKVDTARFETSQPGIFAIGDINHYPGKQKLILSGFHEAALMAKAAYEIVYPDQPWRLQYTTTNTALKKRLGVKDDDDKRAA